MPRILISYRRDDTTAITGRIYDSLCARFGEKNVFMDVDSVPLGVDFREHIAREVARSEVVLVVIGERWLARNAEGRRRLDEADDFVRIELDSALRTGVPVIPLLVGAARMPQPADLPESLSSLAYRNALGVDEGRDFHVHMERLIQGIRSLPESKRAVRPRASRIAAISGVVMGAVAIVAVALFVPQVRTALFTNPRAERAAAAHQVPSAPQPAAVVCAFFGRRAGVDRWVVRDFDIVGDNPRPPRSGDLLRAVRLVNVRSGDLVWSDPLGWESLPEIDLLRPGDVVRVVRARDMGDGGWWFTFDRPAGIIQRGEAEKPHFTK